MNNNNDCITISRQKQLFNKFLIENNITHEQFEFDRW
jgi:hypothetical protein